MAASKARLEALLARVQQRASEPRTPSSAAPMLEAVNKLDAARGDAYRGDAYRGDAARSSADAGTAHSASRAASPAPSAEAPASVRAVAARAVAQNVAAISPVAAQSAVGRDLLGPGAAPQNEVSDDDIEEYDDELIEIIDDAEVIPQAAAVARAIEPAAFGAAVDRRPSAPIRPEPVAARAASARSAPAPEAVAPRPMAGSEVVRARNPRRELRHTSFVELLDASLGLV